MTAKPKDYRRKREPFRFQIDGTTHELASPTYGAMEDLAAAATKEDPRAVMVLIATCTTPETVAVLRTLDAPDVNELFTDWMAALGGGGAGKSSGSST